MAAKKLDYRALSDELDVLLTDLQRSDVQVDEAMKLYEQGLNLINQLEKRLEQAENELVRLKGRAATDQGS